MKKQIYAPWRGQFVQGPKAKGCIFCRIARQTRDNSNYILYRGAQVFVVLNRYPYTAGHLMVVPYCHLGTFEKLNAEIMAEMMTLGQRSVEFIKAQMSPAGFNLGMNLGRAAGAGIQGHLHLHVVPRWPGDSNFMATSGAVRVLSIPLDEIFRLLKKYFDKL